MKSGPLQIGVIFAAALLPRLSGLLPHNPAELGLPLVAVNAAGDEPATIGSTIFLPDRNGVGGVVRQTSSLPNLPSVFRTARVPVGTGKLSYGLPLPLDLRGECVLRLYLSVQDTSALGDTTSLSLALSLGSDGGEWVVRPVFEDNVADVMIPLCFELAERPAHQHATPACADGQTIVNMGGLRMQLSAPAGLANGAIGLNALALHRGSLPDVSHRPSFVSDTVATRTEEPKPTPPGINPTQYSAPWPTNAVVALCDRTRVQLTLGT